MGEVRHAQQACPHLRCSADVLLGHAQQLLPANHRGAHKLVIIWQPAAAQLNCRGKHLQCPLAAQPGHNGGGARGSLLEVGGKAAQVPAGVGET